MKLDRFPTIILLRRVPDLRDEAALRAAVQRAVGHEALATVRFHFTNDGTGMTYYEWRLDVATCHIGQSSLPFRDVGGTFDSAGKPIEWHDRDAGEPDDPGLRAAWLAHAAWIYVDALHPQSACVPALLRLAGELVDDDTLLIWRYEDCRPIRGPMVLPAPYIKQSLMSGQWPAASPA